MAGVLGVEIQIPIQVVCQKPGGKLSGEDKAAHGQGIRLGIRQSLCRLGQEALSEGAEHIPVGECFFF